MNPVIGTTLTLTATFRLIDGTLENPSPVVLTIQAPNGSQTTPTPDNPSTGVFTYELTTSQAGIYRWRFSGTTSEGTAACEDSVCVDASILAFA